MYNSSNRPIVLALNSGFIGSVGRVAARGCAVTRRVKPERPVSRVRQTAPSPRGAAFAIGPVAVSAGLQVSTPSSADTAACPDPQPAHSSPFECCSVSGPCNWPPPFSPAPVSPCTSRTRHGLTMRHFSHWSRRTITIGPFPPCGPPGMPDRRGRKRGGVEAVRWGSVSTHRPHVIVQSCTWYCPTMRHFPGWARRTPHPPARLCPSSVPDGLAWPSAQTRGK